MSERVIRLYPAPGEERLLRGLYLGQRLHALAREAGPFVYANFVSSLDGRIALQETQRGVPYLPGQLVSANDFRLFLELQAQADCLITHGGYLRALAAGRLGNVLQVSPGGVHPDLLQWRRGQGLAGQPALVVASTSLDFPVPESVQAHAQTLYIATGEGADRERVRAWQGRGFEVIVAGRGRGVEGQALVGALARRGYRSLYLVAGPQMLETMLRQGQLSRLYLTLTHQILGGEWFRTMVTGARLGAAGHLRLQALYYDPDLPGGVGQWFAQFDCGQSDIHRRDAEE
jgi:riboflavin biosynthesis pyrimidine reductase